MSTPTLINTGSVFNNANGSITVTLPGTSQLVVNTAALTANAHANLVNITVLAGGGGASQLKQLTDVVGANSGANGYILQINTQGTANTADDTFDFVPMSLDSGEF
jgi:hypothetical protein